MPHECNLPGVNAFSSSVKREHDIRRALLSESDAPAAATPEARTDGRRDTAQDCHRQQLGYQQPNVKEELTLYLSGWEFTFTTPYVSENKFSFSFGVDEGIVTISPMIEAEGRIRYKDSEFPIAFAGGDLRLPGIPFKILSFLKIPAKEEA